MSNRCCHRFRGRIQLRMNGLQIKLSTNFTFTAENPYNWLLFSMSIDEFELGPAIVIYKNSRRTWVNSTFLPNGKHADVMAASSRRHVNTSWYWYRSVDWTPVKPHISIAKSVYVHIRTWVATVLGFRTYIYVRKSESVKRSHLYSLGFFLLILCPMMLYFCILYLLLYSVYEQRW